MRFMYIKYIQQQSSSSKILSFYATQQILLPRTKVSFSNYSKIQFNHIIPTSLPNFESDLYRVQYGIPLGMIKIIPWFFFGFVYVIGFFLEALAFFAFVCVICWYHRRRCVISNGEYRLKLYIRIRSANTKHCMRLNDVTHPNDWTFFSRK